jgi:hypothetical protein
MATTLPAPTLTNSSIAAAPIPASPQSKSLDDVLDAGEFVALEGAVGFAPLAVRSTPGGRSLDSWWCCADDGAVPTPGESTGRACAAGTRIANAIISVAIVLCALDRSI